MIRYQILFEDGFKIKCHDHCFRGLSKTPWTEDMMELNSKTPESRRRVAEYQEHDMSAIHYDYSSTFKNYGDNVDRIVISIFNSLPWFKNFVTVNIARKVVTFHCKNQKADKMFMVMSAFRNNTYIDQKRDGYIKLLDEGYSDLFCLISNSLIYRKNPVFVRDGFDLGISGDGDYNLFLFDSFGERSLRRLLETREEKEGPNLWRQDLWNTQKGYRKDVQLDEEFIGTDGEARELRASDGMSIENDTRLCQGLVKIDEDHGLLINSGDFYGEIARIFNEFNLQAKV